VCMGLDKSGFVRTVEPLLTIVNTPANEVLPIGTRPDRETCITRMACLNTATSVLTCNGPVDVAELLQLAGTLEEWVTRPRTTLLMPG